MNYNKRDADIGNKMVGINNKNKFYRITLENCVADIISPDHVALDILSAKM